MSVIRNILNLPFAILFFFISLVALVVNLFIPKQTFIRMQQEGKDKDTRYRLDSIRPFVKPSDRVLDIGSGNGLFGKAVADEFNAKVSGIDVVDYAKAEIPIKLYDGHKIPHKDGTFDVIIMAFMLHHLKHQEELLSEAVRCSRGKIIIFEDVNFSPWQWLFSVWNDFYTNKLVGAVWVLKGVAGRGQLSVPMPLTFRSVKGWHKLFAEYPVELVSTDISHAKHKPTSKAVFTLEVKP